MNSPNPSPSCPNQRLLRLKRWSLGTALVGTSFLPCPECGMPVAIHTWPFLLLLAARWLVNRQKKRLADLPGDERQSILLEEVDRAK